MTQWDDRVEDASVWDHLEELAAQLDKAFEKTREQEDERTYEAIQRIEAVRMYVTDRLSNADAFLVSNRTLDQLAAAAKDTAQAVSRFVATGDRPHLLPEGGEQSASYHADKLIVRARHLPGLESESDVEGLRDRIGEFKYSSGQYLRHLREEAEHAREQIREFVSQAETELEQYKDDAREHAEKVESEASQRQEEIASAARERLSDLKQEIEHQEQRIQDALDRFKADFDSNQSERKDTFDAKVAEWQDDVDEVVEGYKAEAEQYLEDMEEDRDEVERLMGVIGASGRARGFEKQADYERWASYGWRGLAVLAMGGIVWAAWWLATDAFVSEQFNWPQIVAKMTLLGAFGALAAYAGRQGKKHFERAEVNRQLQLELTSINPYLAGFPEEKKREIKEDMVDRWFGNLPSFESGEGPGRPRDSFLQDMRQMIVDAVQRGMTSGE